jgi:hypothetical protein
MMGQDTGHRPRTGGRTKVILKHFAENILEITGWILTRLYGLWFYMNWK